MLLDSLEIKNFRLFQHLRIGHLGRVNLIVGKNNTGKTSLLEAVWLYAQGATPQAVRRVLISRHEFDIATQADDNSEETELLSALSYLFYNHPDTTRGTETISIGVIDSQTDRVSFTLGWYRLRDVTENYQLSLTESEDFSDLVPRIKITRSSRTYFYPLHTRPTLTSNGSNLKSVLLEKSGLSRQEIGNLWDNIALTDLEQDVVSSLQIIDKRVERINLVDDKVDRRIPKVKLQGMNTPLPMRSLGEGINRLFGLILALIDAQNGFLLIDEIETGLHYSVQPDVWRLIFTLAKRLDVQVFATSHSVDCIKAFQLAAAEHKHTEGVLIRLQQKSGTIRSVTFDENELAIIAREQLEVR